MEYGWTGELLWKNRYFVLKKSKNLLVHTKLNVICSSEFPRQELDIVASEYAYHPNLLRQVLQKGYVFFTTRGVVERFAACATIHVNPWVAQLDRICLIPGNHSIRILEIDSDMCTVVLKRGYRKEYLLNEINIRTRFPQLKIPILRGAQADSLLYREQRIRGVPINRIGDKRIVDRITREAINELKSLYTASNSKVDFVFYVDHLRLSILDAIGKLPAIYSKDDRQKYEEIVDGLTACLNNVENRELITALTHGDFQSANILYAEHDTKNSFYLIDWEYSKVRFILYDLFVFYFCTRSPLGLAERLKQVTHYQNEHPFLHSVTKDFQLPMPTRSDVFVCILEDFLLRLEELDIPQSRLKNKGLEQFVAEVKVILW